MMVLLDTSVLAEIQHPEGDAKVKAAVAALDNDSIHISVITLGEIVKGIALIDDMDRKRELSSWIQNLEREFNGRIMPLRPETTHIWGELTAKAQRERRIISVSDGLIAATAIRYGLHIMTRNADDFASTGAMVINPWE